jgi:hypothetical protein
LAFNRHFVFGIRKMLRPYFRYDRDLLKDLWRVAHECLIEFLRTSLGLPEGVPGIVMAIHLGRVSGFSPPTCTLVADGPFARSRVFHVMPETGLKPLEELFRARVIRFLVDKGLLPPERARMLRGWVHSGFNVHRGRRVLSRERKDMERLAQYIIRNPFSVEKNLGATEPGPALASGSILYRSGMNKKIGRNFEVFTPWDFIAAITQHIADKSFQLVRYYGWYSNKMRGRRAKQTDEEVQTEGDAVEAIDVSAPRAAPHPFQEVARVDQEAVGG